VKMIAIALAKPDSGAVPATPRRDGHGRRSSSHQCLRAASR
jgi:hypothetical protein